MLTGTPLIAETEGFNFLKHMVVNAEELSTFGQKLLSHLAVIFSLLFMSK